jgi:hypothetical protein
MAFALLATIDFECRARAIALPPESHSAALLTDLAMSLDDLGNHLAALGCRTEPPAATRRGHRYQSAPRLSGHPGSVPRLFHGLRLRCTDRLKIYPGTVPLQSNRRSEAGVASQFVAAGSVATYEQRCAERIPWAHARGSNGLRVLAPRLATSAMLRQASSRAPFRSRQVARQWLARADWNPFDPIHQRCTGQQAGCESNRAKYGLFVRDGSTCVRRPLHVSRSDSRRDDDRWHTIPSLGRWCPREILRDEVARCGVLLVLIGPNDVMPAMSTQTAAGIRRTISCASRPRRLFSARSP